MKRTISFVLLLLFFAQLLLAPTLSYAYDKEKMLATIWNKSILKLEKAFKYLDEMSALPEQSFLGKSRGKNAKKINELTYEVLEILGASEANEIRKEIQDLRALFEKKQKKIESLQKEQISAPENGGIFTTTKKEIEEKIAEQKKDLEEIEKEIINKKSRLKTVLVSYGIKGSDKELDVLLNSVTGEDIAEMYGVFQSIKFITGELVLLMEKSGGNIESQKKYYGIYALLLQACVVLQDEFLSKVSNVYLPRLEEFKNQALAIKADAQYQLDNFTDLTSGQKSSLQNNIQLLETQLYVSEKYYRYLLDQNKQVEKMQNKFQSDFKVAFNIYETVSLASELVSLIKSNRQELEMVMNLDIPEMIVFNDAALEKEFQNISDKLRKEAHSRP